MAAAHPSVEHPVLRVPSCPLSPVAAALLAQRAELQRDPKLPGKLWE